MARPTDYTAETAKRICAKLAEGHSLSTVCKADDMPGLATVYGWLGAHREFAEMYARAKDDCCYAMAESIVDIADDGSNDWMVSNNPKNPGWLVNGEAVQRSRLRVDTRKWLLAKLQPRRYGENSNTTVQVDIEVRDKRREIDAMVEALLSPGAVQRSPTGAPLLNLPAVVSEARTARADGRGPPEHWRDEPESPST